MEEINSTNNSEEVTDSVEEETLFRESFQYQIDNSNIVCTVCHKNIRSSVIFKDRSLSAHPLLEVIICNNCKDQYIQNKKPTVCAWCCQKKVLISCQNRRCDLLFCLKCVVQYSCYPIFEADPNWFCFYCVKKQIWKLRAECFYVLKHVNPKSNKLEPFFISHKETLTNNQVNDFCKIFHKYISDINSSSNKLKSNLNALSTTKIVKPFLKTHSNFLFCIAKVRMLHENHKEHLIFVNEEFQKNLKLWVTNIESFNLNEQISKEFNEMLEERERNELKKTLLNETPNYTQEESSHDDNAEQEKHLTSLNKEIVENSIANKNNETSSLRLVTDQAHTSQLTASSKKKNKYEQSDKSDTSSIDNFDIENLSSLISETDNVEDSDSDFKSKYKNALKNLLYEPDSLSSFSSSSSDQSDSDFEKNGSFFQNGKTESYNSLSEVSENNKSIQNCKVVLDSSSVSDYLSDKLNDQNGFKEIQKLANVQNKRSRNSSSSSSTSSKSLKSKRRKKNDTSKESLELNDCNEELISFSDNSIRDTCSNNSEIDDFGLFSLDSSSCESTNSIKSEKNKKKKISKKKRNIFNDIPLWKKDKLLTSNLNSQKKNKETYKNSSDDSTEETPVKKKANKIKRQTVIVLDDSSDEASSESVTFIETSTAVSKKNRKVIPFHLLHENTKKAKKLEQERLQRLQIRNKALALIEENSKPKQSVLDYDLINKKSRISINPILYSKLKKHQIEGIKFMWDSCFESVEQINISKGNGCILAHCMGLGKTLQIITLLHTLFSYPECCVKRVLIIAPLSTISNWMYEFKFWLSKLPRIFKIFLLSKYRDLNNTALFFHKWYNDGGVGIINYKGFQLLVQNYCSDETEDSIFKQVLLNPGPDLVILDEGHYLKNSKTKCYQSVSQIETQRKIILTGTPMQNNLLEYYNMVNLVKPYLLGIQKEFQNRFINPIINGQHKNSSPQDIKFMQKRSHVLHKLLSEVVQRREESILKPYLPPLTHYILYLKMSKVQVNLYKSYISMVKSSHKIISDYHNLKKVWTHPLALHLSKLPIEKPDENDYQSKKWWSQICEYNELENIFNGTKLVILLHIVKEAQSIGDKVVVFSTSLNILNCVEHFITTNNSILDKMTKFVDYLRIDGSTPKQNRFDMCQNFNNPTKSQLRLLLATTKTCGFGINLIGANRVVILDTPWNPADDLQSVFRVYRFGQTKSCVVYSLVALGTMEEKIYESSVTKQAVSCRVIDEQQIDRHFYKINPEIYYKFIDYDDLEKSVPSLPSDRVLAGLLMRHSNIIWSFHEHDHLLKNIHEEELDEDERKLAWEEFHIEESRLQNTTNAGLLNQPSTSGMQRNTLDETIS